MGRQDLLSISVRLFLLAACRKGAALFLFFGKIGRKDNARMIKANADIREAIKAAGLKQWQIADSLKISEITLCRRLRHELAAGEKKQILDIIQELKGVPAP